jgi:hypothetical protein
MLFMYIYLSIYLSFDVLGWVGRLVGDDRDVVGCALY